MRLRLLISASTLALALIGTTNGVGPRSAMASCAGGQSLPHVIHTAPTVFVGTVVSTRDRSMTAVVRVREIWRGPRIRKVVTVKNNSQEDYRVFRKGVTYLFIPEFSPLEGLFGDNACSLTRPYSHALAKYRPASAHRP